MNIKPSWDTTVDMFEEIDPKQKPIFSHMHNYTKNVVHSYSIQDFDLNVLVQNEDKGNFRTVADETIFNKRDISGYKAIPLYDLESSQLTGYQLLNTKKKSQPIKVGAGIPVCNFGKSNPSSFIATDNLNLFFRLSQLNYVAVFHSRINAAFELVDNYFDDQKPRIIATNKSLDYNSDLKVHFDSDVSNLSDQQIKSILSGKAIEIQPSEVKHNTAIQIVNMSDIQAQPITWLWDGWLPLGKMTILAGAGGCGKTNLSLALIATITTGGVFPDGSPCSNVGKVLIYSTEDDPADTLKPRLIANGADISKVSIISGRTNEKGELEPFDPAQDFPKIEEYIKLNPDVKLLMIDPIISAVSGDMNKANDVRRSLQPLVDLANEYKFSVLGITHFSKGSAGSTPADRIIGSQAFTALARMAWSAAKREDEGDCILVRAKSNNSILEGGIRYQIESETVLDHIDTTKTVWLGTIEGTAKELLNEAESAENDNGSMVDMAKEFLIDLLSSVEKMPTKEVQAQAKDAGFSPASIRRAQEKLNIKPFKPQGEKVWFWSLPKIHRLDEPTHF
ncbi:AAA family ATPase [Acinetobacter baumannii]|uniref:AAA family ATPase n=1 Tax=Acinetobacter baumannii TaxID=470 RepID=UPI001127DA9A|nr:AAA family ATPase [Acinetobacter baumannii]MCJ9360440.1 AAA family ATPase [Acinetobacter baumannii]MCJ9407608.1 AAA family ATPase [Acinetobacter baumannii]MDV4266501.1 AAA family ATPase [Acinetobacter baumannii]TPT80537.1 AAA family ATPase [Acinetobacter baumannii]HAV4639216.1 AAA family ATPase [Acinetobacter baumannii]